MKAIKVLLLLVLLSALCYSFNVDKYLYPDENLTDVTETKFTVNDADYTLIEINSEKTFLLKGGELVLDVDEIESAMHDQYKLQYYPSDKDIEEVRNLLFDFNESRHDEGMTFRGTKEENACWYCLFLNIFPCYDEETCKKAAAVFCMTYAEGQACSSYEQFYEPIKDFSYAHNDLEEIMSTSFYKLDNMDEENTYETLIYIQESIPTIKTSVTLIEGSIFRIPESITECPTCYGVCPRMDLDKEQSIPALETKLSTLLTKMGPFAEYVSISGSIMNNTETRLDYLQKTTERDLYLIKFGPLEKRGMTAMYEANQSLSNIYNSSLASTLNSFTNLHNDINQSLTDLNFTDMDYKLAQYNLILTKLENQTSSTNELYGEIETIQDQAELIVFMLDARDLEGDLADEYEELKQKKVELDYNLSSTNKAASVSDIKDSYQELLSSFTALKEKQDENLVLDKLRSFGRKVNSNLDELIESAYPLTESEKQEYANQFPLYISIINLLAISSLGIILYLISISNLRLRTKQMVLLRTLALFLFLCVGIVFSVGFYFYLDKTTNSADFQEFAIALSDDNSTAIILDESGPASSYDYMKGCAAELKSVLEEYNKTVDIVEVNSLCSVNGVAYQGMSKTECINSVDSPSFMFKYSSDDKNPDVSAIFLTQMTLYGDEVYYSKCNIASVMKVAELEG
ncbi:hypothetical protein JXB01_04200 [Candidatus Micrarchaeota archaeon]|nr:hypothetical protein [Candidatus Micrarchaeota archaeon]